jgi:hypothetical protein
MSTPVKVEPLPAGPNTAIAPAPTPRVGSPSRDGIRCPRLPAQVGNDLRAIGGLHRKIQHQAKSIAILVKDIGDRLLALKSQEGIDWAVIKAHVGERYALGIRSMQVYMRIAAGWEHIEQSGVPLESTSLRGLQRLVTRGRSSAAEPDRAPEMPEILSDAVVDYFDGVLDVFYAVDRVANPNACPARATAILDPEMTAGDRLSGRVMAYSAAKSTCEALIRLVTEAAACGRVTEAVLVVPTDLTAKWAALVDGRPRVYLRAVAPGKSMLVGLVDRKRLPRFGAAFSGLGAVHFPYELLRSQP